MAIQFVANFLYGLKTGDCELFPTRNQEPGTFHLQPETWNLKPETWNLLLTAYSLQLKAFQNLKPETWNLKLTRTSTPETPPPTISQIPDTAD